MMNRALCAVFASLFLMPVQAQQAYHDIEGSGSFTSPVVGLDTGRADEIYTEDNKRYEIYEFPRDPADPSWHRAIWQSPSIKYSGTFSLAFEGCWGAMLSGSLNTCPAERATTFDNTVADRVELAIDNWSTGPDSEELKLDRRRYLSFQLYVHSDTEVPRNWTIINQAWQASTKYSPPFAIWMKSDSREANPATGPITLIFATRNDLTDPAIGLCEAPYAGGQVPVPAPGFECPHELYTVQVQRNQWNRFIIQLQPSLQLDGHIGQVAVWTNKSNITGVIADAVWYGAWGYASEANEFDIRLGIYRAQQPRRLKLMFDDVRLGSTATSVDF